MSKASGPDPACISLREDHLKSRDELIEETRKFRETDARLSKILSQITASSNAKLAMLHNELAEARLQLENALKEQL